MTRDKLLDVMAAPIFCHAQFKGDVFTAQQVVRTIFAALEASGMVIVPSEMLARVE